MAPRTESLYTGISHKEPATRKPFGTVDDWLKDKREEDGAEGLWRIHDRLYDLTVWMKKHPGGKFWLETTQGTDVTEAFECSHISGTAEKLLPKFYVREARTPRSSLITFHEDGFFKTLKRKVKERNLIKSTKPLVKTKILADGLALFVFATGLAGALHDYWWAVLSGVFLNMLAVCAHNFFHMRDNWRMYYFNMMLMSHREWRVSHVLSHHLYPNTKMDLEISMFEPFFKFLPREDKKFRYLSWFITPFVFVSIAHVQFVRSGQGLWVSFVTWNLIIASASFFFGLIGLTAAHHHPDIYHDGDFLGDDKDFGLLQLAAVRNRVDVDGNFVLTMIMFGEHALHHMFPTVDHSRLHVLDDVLKETCDEFKINFKPLTIRHMVAGMFQQLVRNYRNSKLKILKN